MYGVFQRLGACAESMMANVKRINPQTLKNAPIQSILMFIAFLSAMSLGTVKYAVIAVMTVKIVPTQKYHPHVVNSAVKPAKKMPMKKPSGAEAP